MFAQRPNVRKFRSANPMGSPRFFADPFVGYQIDVVDGYVRSGFVVYVPRNRELADSFERAVRRDKLEIERDYGGQLAVENPESNAGAMLADRHPFDPSAGETATDWLISSQKRLREALRRSGIEAAYIRRPKP